MIKTLEQALAVQQRRFKSGRRGYAKAVRRWFRRGVDEPPSITLQGHDVPKWPVNFDGCRDWNACIQDPLHYTNRKRK